MVRRHCVHSRTDCLPAEYSSAPHLHISFSLLGLARTSTQTALSVSKASEPETLLFCGWRRDLRDMILLLDSMVPPNTELHILSPLTEAARTKVGSQVAGRLPLHANFSL